MIFLLFLSIVILGNSKTITCTFYLFAYLSVVQSLKFMCMYPHVCAFYKNHCVTESMP